MLAPSMLFRASARALRSSASLRSTTAARTVPSAAVSWRSWHATASARNQGILTEVEADASQAAQPEGYNKDIDVKSLQVTHTNAPKMKPSPKDLVFGQQFTDHMLTIRWTAAHGWEAPEIRPYAPLMLDPSANVLHYASTLFEGMKAYVGKNGEARLFRPDKNMQRMKRTAARLSFPDFDGHVLTQLIKKFVDLDQGWIPNEAGHSLYLRPTMIGTAPGLGVTSPTEVLLFVIASPVGPYYKTGFKPVSLFATTDFVRAAPKGIGSYKMGANYSVGLVPQMVAAQEGHQQILWLWGENDEVTEVGTMNFFAVIENEQGQTELVTAPLENDMILPGVTRDSVLALAREHQEGKIHLSGLPQNLVVSERSFTMGDLIKAQQSGKLKEAFGAGTAAIVSPVDNIGYKGQNIAVPVGDDGLGDVARVMLREIVGRQIGEIPSDWSVLVNEQV